MAKKEDKFFVGTKFRRNKLAETNTNIRAEVHKPGHSIKVYDNIHYPNALAKKIFSESSGVTHIVFKNLVDGSEDTIYNKSK